MKNKPDILWDTIYNKLTKYVDGFEIDIRYLERWIKLYPECFPKFIIIGKYEPKFNWEKIRWEIYKI